MKGHKVGAMDSKHTRVFRIPAGVSIEIKSRGPLSVFAVNAGDPLDRFSAGRTISMSGNVYFKEGMIAYSRQLTPMFKLSHSTVAAHDLQTGVCGMTALSNVAENAFIRREISRGAPKLVDSMRGHECLADMAFMLRSFGVKPSEISSSLNLFLNVNISERGTFRLNTIEIKHTAVARLTALVDLQLAVNECSRLNVEAQAKYRILDG